MSDTIFESPRHVASRILGRGVTFWAKKQIWETVAYVAVHIINLRALKGSLSWGQKNEFGAGNCPHPCDYVPGSLE